MESKQPVTRPRVALLGGTGPAGCGLALRLVDAGWPVILGSRDPDRARAVAGELRSRAGVPAAMMGGGDNHESANRGDIVILAAADATVTTAEHHADALAGKVVVSMANRLHRVGREFHPIVVPDGSVAAGVQRAAPNSLVAAALHHVPAAALADVSRPMVGDVIVVADDDHARSVTMGLVRSLRDLQAHDGGSLVNAAGLESFCSVILTVNLRRSGRVTVRLVPA
jgi:NADPH-dependent F420 reductase